MSLFRTNQHEHHNLLPYDGTVHDYGQIFKLDEADDYFKQLSSDIAWQHDEAIIFGKKVITKRMAAWYGDCQFAYEYSNVTKIALPWTDLLLRLKALVEEKTQETYNACLMGLYPDGSAGVGWHSDGEKDLKPLAAIASLSFGAERKFAFKHKKTKQQTAITLLHGNLLVMKGETQLHWLHCIATSKAIKKPRINLTFRTML